MNWMAFQPAEVNIYLPIFYVPNSDSKVGGAGPQRVGRAVGPGGGRRRQQRNHGDSRPLRGVHPAILRPRITCALLHLLHTIPSPMDKAATIGAMAPSHAHEHKHEELGFWRTYVFSQDHKVIGIQYTITGQSEEHT